MSKIHFNHLKWNWKLIFKNQDKRGRKTFNPLVVHSLSDRRFSWSSLLLCRCLYISYITTLFLLVRVLVLRACVLARILLSTLNAWQNSCCVFYLRPDASTILQIHFPSSTQARPTSEPLNQTTTIASYQRLRWNAKILRGPIQNQSAKDSYTSLCGKDTVPKTTTGRDPEGNQAMDLIPVRPCVVLFAIRLNLDVPYNKKYLFSFFIYHLRYSRDKGGCRSGAYLVLWRL